MDLDSNTRKRIKSIVIGNVKIDDILTIWLSLGYIDNKVSNTLPME